MRCLRYLGLLIVVAFLLFACSGADDQAGNENVTAPEEVSSVANASGGTGQGLYQSACDDLPVAEVYSRSEFLSAMLCVSDDFPWPHSYRPDETMLDSALSRLRDNGEGVFEQGLEYAWISGFNECAWSLEWLEARAQSNSQAEDRALDILVNTVPDYQNAIQGFPQEVLDPTTVNAQRIRADAATLDNPSPIQDFVNHNCQAFEPVGPSSSGLYDTRHAVVSPRQGSLAHPEMLKQNPTLKEFYT